jgi:hypothetical protein
MAAPISMDERREHFAYCVQLFGGTTAFSRRLDIGERAFAVLSMASSLLVPDFWKTLQRNYACSSLKRPRPKNRSLPH